MEIVKHNLYESAGNSSMMTGTRNVAARQDLRLAHKSLCNQITRAKIPVVLIDPDGGIFSLVPLANVDWQEVWNFLLTTNVLVDALHSRKSMASIGHEACTRLGFLHAKTECGLHKGNVKQESALAPNWHLNGVQLCLVLLYVSWCSIDAFAFLAMCLI